jgi:hypothetical protein
MRTLFLVLVAFALGFLVHAYFYSGTVSVGAILAPVAAPVSQNMTIIAGDKPEYEIDYDNGEFKPAFTSVHYGRYIIIQNKGKSLMWITSDYPELNTVRGYGEAETVRVRADRTGSFKIANKLNLNAQATITVVK